MSTSTFSDTQPAATTYFTFDCTPTLTQLLLSADGVGEGNVDAAVRNCVLAVATLSDANGQTLQIQGDPIRAVRFDWRPELGDNFTTSLDCEVDDETLDLIAGYHGMLNRDSDDMVMAWAIHYGQPIWQAWAEHREVVIIYADGTHEVIPPPEDLFG